MRKKPTKKELAKMKVLSDLGHSPTAISREMNKSHHTVIKYLQDHELFNDPEIKGLIETIKKNELDDLFLIGAKARKRIHELLDEGNTKTIETVAVMDRAFQQRRLLEGQSTQSVEIQGLIRNIQDAEKKVKELDAELEEIFKETEVEEVD